MILDGVIEVDYHIDRPTPLTRAGRLDFARRRALVRRQVVTCRACPLRDSGWVKAPVPLYGPLEPSMVVVGEAPGMMENRAGMPFVGPSGQMLKAMMLEAGIDPDGVLYVNTVSCFPHGPPDDRALRACRHNLDAQMRVANSPFVVLAGNVALWQWRADLTVTKSNGTVFVRDGRVFMPMLHPSYVLRSGLPHERERATLALVSMKAMAQATAHDIMPVSGWFGLVCAASGCGNHVNHYDPEGVPHCERHWKSRVPTWTEVERERKMARGKRVDEAMVRVRKRQQGAM